MCNLAHVIPTLTLLIDSIPLPMLGHSPRIKRGPCIVLTVLGILGTGTGTAGLLNSIFTSSLYSLELTQQVIRIAEALGTQCSAGVGSLSHGPNCAELLGLRAL